VELSRTTCVPGESRLSYGGDRVALSLYQQNPLKTSFLVQTIFHWIDVLNAYEKCNPRSFDYFYHFHCIHGLEEDDLSPSERLQGIMEYSESDYELILDDLGRSIVDILLDSPCSSVSLDFSDNRVACDFCPV
jgi:hypothetical protein